MTLVIEDEKALAELERLSTGLSIPPEEVVRRAVLEKAEREPEPVRPWKSRAEFEQAVRDLQDWGAAHRDPSDTRTPDEIIGYNEQGLFD
jgi:hypothetical protein